MSHPCKSPTMTIGPEVKSPFLTTFPSNALCPHRPWGIKNGTPPQGSRYPYYNQCHSPNGYWGSPGQWSPNRWEPTFYSRCSWGSRPRAPQASYYKPEMSVYRERKHERLQVTFKQKRGFTQDIRHYYSPSMVKDPWAELQAKDKTSTSPNSESISKQIIVGSKEPS